MEGETISQNKIRRGIRTSRINSWSIIGFASLSSIGVFFFGDFYGALVGLAVALSGCMELRGSLLLAKGSLASIRWLVSSQLYLIAVLLGYSYNNLVSFDASDPWARFSPGLKDLILAINPDVYLVETMLTLSYYAVYVSLIVAVLIYQGGLSLYYLSRKKYLYPKTP